ncbi:MAG TPA: sugar nucleotide-binding protein [Gemmatimonadaceae bacterium]|nr:sugar nucleotide-binding protein [Gemmatimonadaceae bacterium]
MRVFVLGHRGMLGHVVARAVAERGHEVVTSNERYGGAPRDPLIEAVRSSGCPAVFNCLGSTKRREQDLPELYRANAQMPAHLAARARANQHIIHASTDCVFDGQRGNYRVDEEPTADDPYGFSKRLGEMIAGRPNVTVLRVSIIGPDARPNARGLLPWFLSSSTTAEGYTNWRWNGITTLEWADVALDVIERRHRGEPLAPVLQPGTMPISKYELLVKFRDAYRTRREIVPVAAPTAIDRTLVPTERRPPIDEQLIRLREWYAEC